MRTRRFAEFHNHLLFIGLFLLLGIACHTQGAFTFFEFFDYEPIPLRLYSVALMIAIYLGYKGGKWLGFWAGLISNIPATLSLVILGYTQNEPSEFYSIYEWRWVGYGFRELIFISVLGFVSGYLFDKLDDILSKQGLSLDDLLPLPQHERKWYLELPLQVLRRWMQPWHTAPSPATDADETTADTGSTTADVAEPVTEMPSMRRIAALGAEQAVRRAEKIAQRTKQVARPIKRIIIFVLAVIAVLILNLKIEGTPLQLFPESAFTVLILALAFVTSSRMGVLLAFSTWGLGLILTPDMLDMLEDIFSESFDEMIEFPFVLIIPKPVSVIGLSILAWWAGKLGAVYRDEEKRTRVAAVWHTYATVSARKPAPPDVIFVVLLLLGFALSLTIVERFHLSYRPHLALCVAVCLLAHRYDPQAVSNWILISTGIFSLVSIRMTLPLLDFTGGQVLSIPHLKAHYTIYGAIALAGFTRLAGSLDLRQKMHCRFLVYGFIITLVLSFIYTNNRDIMHYTIKIVNIPGYKVTKKSLENLKSEGISGDILKQLEEVKDKEVRYGHEMGTLLRSTIGEASLQQYGILLKQHTRAESEFIRQMRLVFLWALQFLLIELAVFMMYRLAFLQIRKFHILWLVMIGMLVFLTFNFRHSEVTITPWWQAGLNRF